MLALTDLASVKEYLGITASTDDTLIGNLITRAQSMIETYCNRDSFDSASYTEYRDPNRRNSVVVRNTPITVLTSVSTRATSSTWTAVSSDEYDFDADSGTVGIVSTSVDVWARGGVNPDMVQGRLGTGLKAVQIVYTGGYSSIPGDLEQGCIDLVAHLYGGGSEARLSRARGIASESLGYTSWTYLTDEAKASFMAERFGSYKRAFV